MPELDSPIHLEMLRDSPSRKSLPARLFRAVRNEWKSEGVYGLEWGDPETWAPLKFIRDRYVMPYVNPDHVAVEIGAGGGRWTRYLLDFRLLYAVDYHEPLLQELRKKFRRYPQVRFIRNNGSDFPGIEPLSVDYLFSFGTFVHLDFAIIESYLHSIRPIMKPNGQAVIAYSDKAKIMAKINPEFSDNDVERMRSAVQRSGFRIVEEDNTTMWHSSIVRFTPQG